MVHCKNKGNSFELQCIKLFKEMTNEEIFSSRFSNRQLDNEGVDFETTEYYVQSKAVEKSINTHKILNEMKDGKDKLLFHKRNRQGIVVSMNFETFKKMIEKK